MANVKQLFGPDKLSGLSRNMPQARLVTNVKAKLDHGPVVGKMDNNIHWMNLYTVVNTIGFHNTYPLDSDLSGPSCSKGGQYYPPDKSLSSGSCNCLP